VSQAASSVGPVLYGFMSDGLGSQKVPLLVFLGVMVIGYGVVWKVTNRWKGAEQ
jgi:MFS-type transporter involved in bile tolerance (Atg22 family)